MLLLDTLSSIALEDWYRRGERDELANLYFFIVAEAEMAMLLDFFDSASDSVTLHAGAIACVISSVREWNGLIEWLPVSGFLGMLFSLDLGSFPWHT